MPTQEHDLIIIGGGPGGYIAAIRAATRARDHRMFAGKLDPKVLSGAQRASLLVFRGLRGDFRDWDEIRQWADGIAEQLAAVGSSQSGGPCSTSSPAGA